MAIDFPNSPELNQIFTSGSKAWIWSGSSWKGHQGSPAVTLDGAETLSNKTLGSDLDADGFTITGLGAPSASADAATKGYVDTGLAAASVADGSITSAKIADGTIVDGDVSATAAIAQSKVSGLISDLAAKETPAGAQSKADAAKSGAEATAASALSSHEADTTNVHGIADTSLLATKAYADSAAATAAAAVVDTAPAALDTLNELAAALGDDPNFATSVATSIGLKADASALSSHESDTTNIHGIVDTASLVLTTDSRLSNTRTPTDGSVTTAKIADSQVTSAKIADGTIVDGDVSASAGVALSKLASSAGLSVVGRATNTTGSIAAIVAANDGEVLRRSGTSVAFGTVDTSSIADSAVTSAKIADGTIVNADINASAAIAQSKIANLQTDLNSKVGSSSPTFSGTATFQGTANFQSGSPSTFATAPTVSGTTAISSTSAGVTSISVDGVTVTVVQDGTYTASLTGISAGTVLSTVVGGVSYDRPVSTVSDSAGTTTITLQFSTFQTGSVDSISWPGLLTVVAAPAQSGNSGKYLTTDGTTASWGTISGGASPDDANLVIGLSVFS